ncbi:MAG: hypothetical protein N2Z23_10525 [Pyrinomonadaceae bacterium]|nr:hypothetical protein [Pyrinomonadaceae bacterium]MCX7640859.1 hypothetical protein [Pyrinomonadaceae bacterium]MDW8304568.1 hypothetical protein [Acidobacteriota bacterium]
MSYKAPEELKNFQRIALGVGGIGTLALLIGGLISPEMREQALRSWLLGFVFWGGISIGSLGILLLQYLTGGAWGVIIRRIVEASSRTLTLVAVMFIPILLGASTIYEWTHPEKADETLKRILDHRAPYLNLPAWIARAVIYFGLWFLMVYLLNKWSKQMDETGDWKLLKKASQFSGPAMVFFVLLVSFASIDWVMTLDPHFYSTIWGFLFAAGWGLASYAFTIAVLAWLSTREPMNQVIGRRHFHDLGKLLLAFVMVWAYFNFSQFLIIWSGNLPEETFWYLERMEGGWGIIGVILIVFHFAFPFVVLLSRDVKRNARWLASIAIFIIVMRFVDLYYIIGPSPRVTLHGAKLSFSESISWMDFVGPLAVGGLWLWYFFGELQKRPLVPVNDPFLESAIEHGKSH